MEKVIKLTESDLTQVVKKIINESKHDRIVNGEMIKNNRYKSFIEDGFIPYYLDLSIDGNYKIVKLKNLNGDLPRTTFYFLDDREHNQLSKLVDSTNELISNYKKMISLYKKQLIGVLEQKIIK
jgi:hypothetical protein